VYVKAMTTNCDKCTFMKIQENGDIVCRWGNSKKPKKLESPKGKKALRCNLVQKEKENGIV